MNPNWHIDEIEVAKIRLEEGRDREGYARQPQTPEELSWLEANAVWPEEEATENIRQTY